MAEGWLGEPAVPPPSLDCRPAFAADKGTNRGMLYREDELRWSHSGWTAVGGVCKRGRKGRGSDS